MTPFLQCFALFFISSLMFATEAAFCDNAWTCSPVYGNPVVGHVAFTVDPEFRSPLNEGYISKICIRHSLIDGIQEYFKHTQDETEAEDEWYGGNGGTYDCFVVPDGDCINGYYVRANQYIEQLQFYTMFGETSQMFGTGNSKYDVGADTVDSMTNLNGCLWSTDIYTGITNKDYLDAIQFDFWMEGPIYAITDFGVNPSSVLGECEGDCDDDSDCEDGLRCWQRNVQTADYPPMCGGGTFNSNWDYCYRPYTTLRDVFEPGTVDRKLAECEGDCNNDSECKGSLKCFQRTPNGETGLPPGCEGIPNGNWDYCYDPDAAAFTISVSSESGSNVTNYVSAILFSVIGCTVISTAVYIGRRYLARKKLNELEVSGNLEMAEKVPQNSTDMGKDTGKVTSAHSTKNVVSESPDNVQI